MEGKVLMKLEKEEGEILKRELERRGVDKLETDNLSDMRNILSAMEESMEMNRTENDMRNQKKDSSSSSNNFVRDVDAKAESILENQSERYKPSRSCNISHSSNSELPNISDKHNIICGRKNSDDNSSDDSLDKYSYQKSKNTKYEFPKTRMEKKLFAKSELHKKMIRWRLDPLDSHSDQNDVPLKQPPRPLVQERAPFRLCKDACTIEKGNEVIKELSIHLNQMADLWLSGHGSTELKFQWGTPIQVDSSNNSSDKKPLMIVSNSSEVGNINTNYNRTSKRKAIWVTNATSSNSSSDENDEISFTFLKRKRAEGTNVTYQILHNKEQVENDTKVVDGKINSNNVNVKVQQEPNKRVVSPEIINPRRITLSKTNILDKKRAQSPLSIQNSEGSSKDDTESSPIALRKENIGDKLTSEDKIKELDKSSDESNEAILNEDVVIKPLPMKSFSARLAKQCALLKHADAERKKKTLMEQKEAEKKVEEEKEKRKEDFIRRRMKEMEKTFQEEEELKRKEKEKDKWLELLQSRNKTRMQKWKEQEQKEIEKQQREALLLQDNDDLQMTEEKAEFNNCLEQKITCPICNKSFPSDKIENHAAMCEQFQTDSEYEQDNIYSAQSSKYAVKEKTKKSEAIYECNICSSFKTNNGIDYEDHVNSCIQQKQNSVSQVTIAIPNSPVRSYRPISEQKNSNIDYSGQLGSVSKAQAGRKRKR